MVEDDNFGGILRVMVNTCIVVISVDVVLMQFSMQMKYGSILTCLIHIILPYRGDML